MVESTEFMLQRSDSEVTELLNRARNGLHTETDIQFLEARQKSPDVQDISKYMHVFAMGKEVTHTHNFNDKHLQ